MKLVYLFVLSTMFLVSNLYGQEKGSVSGKVVDVKTGEPIIGANILLEGSNLGAATDLSGKYTIKNIPFGTYTVICSYISYSKTKITNVEVSSEKIINLNITLNPEAIEVDEVVVVDKKDNSYESALINHQKKSIYISDGISAEQIKKTTDATTADALRRVSGITLSEDKFIFVRGTSERYSGALLNNSPLASTEPDKKSFAFDLIPSNLIENSIVIKSFTPDNPGNFTGGLIKVNTVDFPTEQSLSFNYSSSFIPDVTTKSFTTYHGGKNDFLGVDDGSRALPGDFPDDLSTIELNKDSLYKVAKLLSNTWKTENKKTPINQSFNFSYGDIFSLFDQELGVISSLSYKSSYFSNSISSKEFMADGISKRFDLEGNESSYSVLWGALLNLSYKLGPFHKIGFRNSYTVNGDDEVIELSGIQYDKSFESRSTAIRFVSRTLYSGQLFGESYLPLFSGIQLNWRTSYSKSHRDEPDYRRYTYGRDIGSSDPFVIILGQQPTLGYGGRYFSVLNENLREYGLDVSFPLWLSNIKMGVSYEKSDRGFSSRLISVVTQIRTAERIKSFAIDSIFAPKNFNVGGFSIGEYINGTNNYSTEQDVFGNYFMFDLPLDFFIDKFRLIAGVRNEIGTQRLRTLDFTRQFPIVVDRLEANLLPSINLIYKLTNEMNLRLSFTRTMNRPEFREISPFSYYDFSTQTSVKGNEELVSAKISNYDLRYEMFPGIGELLSFSVFYKELVDAIEKVVVPTSFGEARSFSNASFAKNYGFEIEVRTALGNWLEPLSNFYLNTNYTWVKSEIENIIGGKDRSSTRPLQGQSPFILNLSLNYKNDDWGTSATILFNKIGRRIIEVANQYNDDVYEEPRDLIDFVLSQKITSYFDLKFSIKDLLAKDQIITQLGEIVRSKGKHPVYSLGASIKI